MPEAKQKLRIEPVAGQVQAPPALLAFVGLESNLRKAEDLRTLQFVLANDTREVITCRQVFVLVRGGKGWRVAAVSAMPDVNHEAPLVRAISALAAQQLNSSAAQLINLDEAPAMRDFANAAIAFRHGLLSPLRRGEDAPFAALLYLRERPWREQDIALSEAIAERAAHAWLALAPKATGRPGLLGQGVGLL